VVVRPRRLPAVPSSCPVPFRAASFQALASFSPDHVAPLLALLIAVIDQDRPSVGEQGQGQGEDGQLTPPTPAPSPAHEQSPAGGGGGDGGGAEDPRKAAEASAASGKPPPSAAAGTGDAVQRVSCTGADAGGAADASWGAAAATATAEAAAEARRDLLQRACLRLFVTGMDLFFPSCAQRCSLLARYLSKYLR